MMISLYVKQLSSNETVVDVENSMLGGSLDTMAWHVLRLWMEEVLWVWRVAANILNKQLWTADKGWSSSLEVGRGADNP
jgi:hypothetical protein